GFASRLMEEIRNKRGLAYSVYGYFDADKHTGSFQIVMQTKNESAKKAISILIEEMNRIRETFVTEVELERAKRYLIGSFPLRLDTQAKLASFLLRIEYHGLGLDYPERYPELIKSVTREDILRVAKKYIKPEQLLIVMVGNKKEAMIDGDDKK
ncbi:MAG: insulinase family protein, partial [Syntrophorhabdaceae bacterium]|nr:insulinase family protein [Syntrophorhabdaceae bacterium]